LENEFDHIEDSIRKGFDGFELPVSDTDWSRIAAAMEKGASVKPVVWWKRKTNKRLLTAGILLLFISGIIYWLSNENTTKNIHTNEMQRVEKDKGVERQAPAASGENGKERNVTEGEVTGGNPSGPSTAIQSPNTDAGSDQPNKTGRQNRQNSGGVNPIHIANDNPGDGNPNTNPANPEGSSGSQGTVQNPSANTNGVEIAPDFQWLPGKGLKVEELAYNTSDLVVLPMLIDPVVKNKIKPPTPPVTLPFYVGLQTTYAPGNLKLGNSNVLWTNVKDVNGKFSAVNLRLDAGVMFGNQDWKFTVGGAFEGTALQDKKRDSIVIQVADRFLSYQDTHGTTLYYLAIRWHDSVIYINNGPKMIWAELPIGFNRSFQYQKDLKINFGFTFNPGIMLNGSGNISSPFVYRAGSEWDYVHGIKNADTTTMVIAANPYLNKYRLGSGIQLGIEKEMGYWNWAIQAQTRYYFTPVWKTGVPIKQNTLQYGINLRLGFKI